MIFVGWAEPGERRRIMSHQDAAHVDDDRRLPGVIFSEALTGLTLESGGNLRMNAMNSLPSKFAEVSDSPRLVPRAFQNFRECHGTDPKLCFCIPPQPVRCRAGYATFKFVEKINHERRVEKATLPRHARRTFRVFFNRFSKSASTSAAVTNGSSAII